MKKFVDLLKNKKYLLSALSAFAFCVLLTTVSHASGDSSVSSSVSSSLQTVAADIKSTLGTVAPVGLGIAGAFLAWKLGMKFFKSLTH